MLRELRSASSKLIASVCCSTFALLASCTSPGTPATKAAAQQAHCPIAGSSWSRWNDAYGLNVAGLVVSEPGWVYAFDQQVKVIHTGSASEVEVVLRPAPMDRRNPPRTAEQHVFGYWPHTQIGFRPEWVQVRCGEQALMRVNNRPYDDFYPDPPQAPPTVPPAPPAG